MKRKRSGKKTVHHRRRKHRKNAEPNPRAGTFDVLVVSDHGKHHQNSLATYDDAMKSARGFEKDVVARGETARVTIREHTPSGVRRRANW